LILRRLEGLPAMTRPPLEKSREIVRISIHSVISHLQLDRFGGKRPSVRLSATMQKNFSGENKGKVGYADEVSEKSAGQNDER